MRIVVAAPGADGGAQRLEDLFPLGDQHRYEKEPVRFHEVFESQRQQERRICKGRAETFARHAVEREKALKENRMSGVKAAEVEREEA